MNFDSCSDHLSVPEGYRTDNISPSVAYQLDDLPVGVCQIHWVMEISGHAKIQIMLDEVSLAQYECDVPGDWKLVADGGVYYVYEDQVLEIMLRSVAECKMGHLRNIHVLVKPLEKGKDRRLTEDEAKIPTHLQPAMEGDAPDGYTICSMCEGEKVVGPDGEACNCARYGQYAGYMKKGRDDARKATGVPGVCNQK